jgi:putative aldouronate transport system permease protein
MKRNEKAEHIIRSRDEKAIEWISIFMVGLAALICSLPCLHVVSKSMSSANAVTGGLVKFWPIGIQFETIQFILKRTIFPRALGNTILVTVAGTIISMLVTITTAYPLSKPELRGRKLILLLYIFSMLFYGGMVPAFMVVKTLGILDTYAALILPFVIVQFNMLVVKNYIEGLPESIEESAKLDGAGYFTILFKVILPMSLPVIATVTLLYAVNYWNNYFHALMYTSSPSMKTLQLFLYDTIYSSDDLVEKLVGMEAEHIAIEGLRSAAVVLSIIPIILFYPFVQRYFVAGITIGSVKG